MNGGADTRLSSLDALRGLAALGVVVYHYSMRFPEMVAAARPSPFAFQLGYYGVHLFFMISGFVILMSLDKSGGRGFIKSRFIRLYPLYWASVLLTSAVLLAAGGTLAKISTGQIAVNLTMLEDYFKTAPIDGVYWSLSYELGFYALLFALFRFGLRRFVPALPAAFTFMSLAYVVVQPFVPHPLQYLLVFNAFAHLFACGLALYLIRERGFRLDWAIVVAAAPIIQFFHDGAVGFFPVALAAGLMTSGALFMRAVPGWAAPLLFLGTISYGLYLTHQMIGYVLLLRFEAAGVDAGLSILLTLIIMIAVAAALTYGVDKPAGRALKRLLGGPRLRAGASAA